MAKQTTERPKISVGLMTRLKDNMPVVVVSIFSIILFIMIGIKGGAPQIFNIIVTGGMWALLATGLALVFGVMNIPHFAHGESFMVGAYVAYFVFTPLNKVFLGTGSKLLIYSGPFIAIIAAGLAGVVLGVIIEKLVFAPLRHRTKEGWIMNAFLLTVGLSFILTNGTTLTLGPNFRGIPRYFDVPAVEILGAFIAVDRIVAAGIAI
ncbi:MAG: branched-chain amino acid ABC transporter permease, partial [Anaerolineales bacterium]